MANCCSFSMKATGDLGPLLKFVDSMQGTGKYQDKGMLGRIYDIDSKIESDDTNGHAIAYLSGTCAWSILSAMIDIEERTILSESEEYGIVLEGYSSEPGMCFQEHYLIDKGEIVFDTCIDYEEHWVEDFPSVQSYNEEYNTNLTESMINEDGVIAIGGFGDSYGQFLDHSSYLKEGA